jgi:SAM-dependent methyltransferase
MPDSAHDHPDQHEHRPTGHEDHAADANGLLDLLDLDALVLHDYWSAVLDWVQHAAADRPRTRLLDLGAGTGTASIGLAERFPAADIVAIDLSADSLGRLDAKAAERGFAPRVHTVEVDLDGGWPDVGQLDLIWASNSLHHMADPSRVLRDALAATNTGGQIAVAEFSQPLRFLPDELGPGRPGFEERTLAVLRAAHAEALPTLGSAWAPRLAETGWRVIDERDFAIDLDPPRHPSAARYAYAWFERFSNGPIERLEPDDRETLAALLDRAGPHSLLACSDLHVRGTRTVTLAGRD